MNDHPALTRAQGEAIAHVAGRAREARPEATAALRRRLAEHGGSGEDLERATTRLRGGVRIALAFHPDRVTRGGRSVVEGLLADGRYRNQFETGVSSGSTSGFAGGRRDVWERTLFGGRYHEEGTSWEERPKYGALHLVDHPDGPCPRFGSCYFVLGPHVSSRCTFTLLGSQGPDAARSSGTLEDFEPVLAALAGHLETAPRPLGCEGLTLARLVRGLGDSVPFAPEDAGGERMGRALDSFVEAQVHGAVTLERDVEALVVDASFHGTRTGDLLIELASTYGFEVRWHPGFCLAAADVPPEFRGFETRRLAERVAVDGLVDAAALGAGENDYRRDPRGWDGFGTTSEVLTRFRRVWHVLVLQGGASAKWRGLAVP